MVKISLVMCVLAIFVFAQVVKSKTTAAPAPAVDCSTIIFSMADCLTFVTNGSKVTKPEGSCCNGLKTVLKTDAQCLCEVFKNSGSLGIVLDIKKSMTLPAACGVSAPSIDKCGLALALSPGGAPAQSPRSTVLPPISSGTTSLAPAPSRAQDTTTGSSQVAAPALAPSAASTSTMSSLALLVSLVVASYSFL